VDIYKDGKIVSHDGGWVAEGKNKAGIASPDSYYQVHAITRKLRPA